MKLGSSKCQPIVREIQKVDQNNVEREVLFPKQLHAKLHTRYVILRMEIKK